MHARNCTVGTGTSRAFLVESSPPVHHSSPVCSVQRLYTALIYIELNEFIHALDKRLEKSAKEAPGRVAKKERKLGLPSTSVPPKQASRWAVKTSMTA